MNPPPPPTPGAPGETLRAKVDWIKRELGMAPDLCCGRAIREANKRLGFCSETPPDGLSLPAQADRILVELQSPPSPPPSPPY